MSNGGGDLPNFDALVTAAVEQLMDPQKLGRLQKAMTNAVAEGQVTADGAIYEAQKLFIRSSSKALEWAEEIVGIIVKPLALLMVTHLLGLEATDELLHEGLKGGTETTVGRAVANVFWKGMQPPSTDLQPGDENALRFMSMVCSLTLNSWYEGLLAEETIEAVPGLSAASAVSDLGKELINHLGLNRLMRAALKPLVDETMSTPLRWKVNTLYRPSRLGASAIVRQIARGRWSREQGFRDLQQQGYSDDRIEAILNEAARFLSLDDAMLLVRNGTWTEDQIVEDLGHQGYDESIARLLLVAFKEKRLLAIRDNIISTAITAYAARDIDEPAFRKIVKEAVPDPAEQQEHLILGGTQRELKKNRLNHGEVKDGVKAGILSFRDYRRWLDQQRYSPDDALTLELLLRHEQNKAADLEKHRAEILAERQQAQADKRAADEQRLADLEALRALHRRGSLADLSRAAVRGLIPFARVEEILTPQYDADTVAIVLGLIEADRETYLAQQAAAVDARQRAATRNIDLGQLEAAVLEGVLTIDDFAGRLAFLKFTPEDAAILRDTLAAKLDDRAAATQAHDRAAAAAAMKAINLSQFEQLVRRGHRTLDDYDALLASLGFDDASRAGLVELLQLTIADDQAAAQARADAAAHPPAKGLTLDQVRRAVLLGTVTPEDFQQYLLDQHFSADAQIVLMADLRETLATAEAARQKRTQTGPAPGSPLLPLTTIARAARLGLISVAVYQQALTDRGYTPDDVALDTDLLVLEIADVQAARAKRAVLAAPAPAAPPIAPIAGAPRPPALVPTAIERGLTLPPPPLPPLIPPPLLPPERELTLEQVRRAVMLGVQPIAAYEARARALRYSDADVATLVAVLGQELAAQVDATARRSDVAARLKAQGVSLEDIEAAVRSGTSTLDTYRSTLESLQIDPVEVDLLAALLAGELTAAAPAA